MRDIVATIQPEQYEVVSADLDRTICVQGAPGTGKTAVGLHRAAYLLHTHRTRLARSGVLVVGPNRAFMHYIGQVLPALGEVEVRQVTVAELVEGVPVRSVDPRRRRCAQGRPAHGRGDPARGLAAHARTRRRPGRPAWHPTLAGPGARGR